MKAFLVDGYGPSIRLRAGQVSDPVVGDGDVLVRILASGVNPLDSKIMAGEFKLILPYRTPFVLGNDLAGVVERVGRSVRRFAPGDEVYGRPGKDRQWLDQRDAQSGYPGRKAAAARRDPPCFEIARIGDDQRPECGRCG